MDGTDGRFLCFAALSFFFPLFCLFFNSSYGRCTDLLISLTSYTLIFSKTRCILFSSYTLWWTCFDLQWTGLMTMKQGVNVFFILSLYDKGSLLCSAPQNILVLWINSWIAYWEWNLLLLPSTSMGFLCWGLLLCYISSFKPCVSILVEIVC